jgi:hypothetical protein
MVEVAPPPSRHRLVGQPLLYAISVFASLGVFLVRCASVLRESKLILGPAS